MVRDFKMSPLEASLRHASGAVPVAKPTDAKTVGSGPGETLVGIDRGQGCEVAKPGCFCPGCTEKRQTARHIKRICACASCEAERGIDAFAAELSRMSGYPVRFVRNYQLSSFQWGDVIVEDELVIS